MTVGKEPERCYNNRMVYLTYLTVMSFALMTSDQGAP
jgi:hypothetical protein